MAIVDLKHPTDLLGRSVSGAYRLPGLSGHEYAFSGVVESIVLPATGCTDHHVEFYVCGEYISLCHCFELEFTTPSVA